MPRLLHFRQHVVAEHLDLVFETGLDAARANTLRQRAHERKQQDRRADDREDGEKEDFLGHGYLTGGRRSASRCLATSRSRKSTRSPNSLTCVATWRSSSTSARRSRRSSAVSSSCAAVFLPSRAAIALPIGEMAS